MLSKNMIKLEDYNRNIFSSKIDYSYIDVDAIDYIEVNCNSIHLLLNSRYRLIFKKTVHNVKAFKHFGLIGNYYE